MIDKNNDVCERCYGYLCSECDTSCLPHICDCCNEYTNVLYEYNGEEYCKECLLKGFTRVDTELVCETCNQQADNDEMFIEANELVCVDCLLESLYAIHN